MLKVEPVANRISFKSGKINQPVRQKDEQKVEGTKPLLATLGVLATLGTAFCFLKTRPTTFEDALKKAGVEIKNNVATKIGTGERFSGKIERFENINRKETVEYIDGIITEKLYHSALGRELAGEFYKNGELVYSVGISRYGKYKYAKDFYHTEKLRGIKTEPMPTREKNLLDKAREYVRKYL